MIQITYNGYIYLIIEFKGIIILLFMEIYRYFCPILTKTKMAHSYVVEFFNITFHEYSFIHSLLVTEGGQAENVFVKRGFTLLLSLCSRSLPEDG